MCTIVALHGLRIGEPLVVAANRDEVYARPAAAVARLQDDPIVVGGRDLVGGGTWMGVTATGLVVAVTNQRGAMPAGDRRSRGTLVMEALAAGSVDAIRALLARTDARDYHPFNLLFGDGQTLDVAYARSHESAITTHGLAPGVWVLANDRIGAPEYPKLLRAEQLVRHPPNGSARDATVAPYPELVQVLRAMLADHDRPPLADVAEPSAGSPVTPELASALQALCIHTPHYGTRSSSIVAVAPGRVLDYQVADGPPCTTPFHDVRGLFATRAHQQV